MTGKGGKKPKYEIPDIAGPELSAQDRSTEKVLDFLVRGAIGDIASRDQNESVNLRAHLPPSDDEDENAALPFRRDEEGEATQAIRKKKSLDHLFSLSGQQPKNRPEQSSEIEAEPLAAITDSSDVIERTGVPLPAVPEHQTGATLEEQVDNPAPLNQISDGGVDKATILESQIGMSLESFRNRFGQLLRDQPLSLCEEIFNNTIATGKSDYFTTTSELTRKIGVQQRQCYNILSKLESMGFINRTAIKENGRLLGIRIGLNLNPFK